MRILSTLIATVLWTTTMAAELSLPPPHDGFHHQVVASRMVSLTLSSATGGTLDAENQYSYSLALKGYTLFDRLTGEMKPRKTYHKNVFVDRKVRAGDPSWEGPLRIPRYYGWGDYEYRHSVRDDAGNTADADFILRLGRFEADIPEPPEPPPEPIETVFFLLPHLSLADHHVHRVSVVNFDDKNVKYEWEFIPAPRRDQTPSERATGVLPPGMTSWNVNTLVESEEGNHVAGILCIESSLSRLLVSDTLASKSTGSMIYHVHEHRHNDSRGCEAVSLFSIHEGG